MSGSSSGIWLDAEHVMEAAQKSLEFYIRRLKREHEDAVQAAIEPRTSFFRRGVTREQAESLPGMGIKRYFIENPRENRAYRLTADLEMTAATAHDEWMKQVEDGTTGARIFVCSTDFRMIERFYMKTGPEMPPIVEETQE